MVYIDLEKAYDRVSRELIWKSLATKEVSSTFIRIIRDISEGLMTNVCTPKGDTNFFKMEASLHQGSALSPFLFTLVLDVLTREIQGDIMWCLLFANDIALVDETRDEVSSRLEI